MKLVRQECEKNVIIWQAEALFEYMHRFEDKQAGEQLTLSKFKQNTPILCR